MSLCKCACQVEQNAHVVCLCVWPQQIRGADEMWDHRLKPQTIQPFTEITSSYTKPGKLYLRMAIAWQNKTEKILCSSQRSCAYVSLGQKTETKTSCDLLNTSHTLHRRGHRFLQHSLKKVNMSVFE